MKTKMVVATILLYCFLVVIIVVNARNTRNSMEERRKQVYQDGYRQGLIDGAKHELAH